MKQKLDRPSIEEIDQEIERLRYQKRTGQTVKRMLYSLVVVAAVAVLAVTIWMPVLRITGSSMKPTLNEGEIVLAMRTKNFKSGDVIAFYYDNKILIKRVIAAQGQYVDIRENGSVLVDGEMLEEPYLLEKALGECNIQLPYQVGEGQIFVMGDDRQISLDSRSTMVGTVSEEKVLGRVVFRIWPLSAIGRVK